MTKFPRAVSRGISTVVVFNDHNQRTHSFTQRTALQAYPQAEITDCAPHNFVTAATPLDHAP
jgi:hypothetical protein